MTNWKPGMKAVCVKSSLDGSVTKDQVYTISEVSVCHTTFLHIEGVGRRADNWCVKCGCGITFGWKFGEHAYFRPLVDQAIDAMLDGIEEPVEEEHLIPELA